MSLSTVGEALTYNNQSTLMGLQLQHVSTRNLTRVEERILSLPAEYTVALLAQGKIQRWEKMSQNGPNHLFPEYSPRSLLARRATVEFKIQNSQFICCPRQRTLVALRRVGVERHQERTLLGPGNRGARSTPQKAHPRDMMNNKKPHQQELQDPVCALLHSPFELYL